MIRVLHFVDVINRHDFIDSVLTSLDRSRFEVAALTLGPPGNRTGAYLPDESYETQCLHQPLRLGSSASVLKHLLRRIREFKPDILQSHHYDESIVGAAAKVIGGVPGFVVGHHYSDHIYVLTRGLKRRIFLAGESAVNAVADKVVVPSQEVVDLLLKQGAAVEKVVKIPYGADKSMVAGVNSDNAERIRAELGLDGKFVGLTTCRLNKEKGLDNLLKAVAWIAPRFPQFRLVMVGDGPIRGELERMVAELDLQGVVTFVGWRTDVLDWISIADLVFQPSISESFCQVVIEALLLKKPIVMTPVGVAPEVIISGKRGGYIVPIGSIEPIADAIVAAFEDPQILQRLGESGSQFVLDHFSTQAVARRYEELYEDVYRSTMPYSAVRTPA
jgi:glycosyltransferase involved in cell wall biosynthesis